MKTTIMTCTYFTMHLQGKVLLERRRSETKRVVVTGPVSVQANVAVGEEVGDEELFVRV